MRHRQRRYVWGSINTLVLTLKIQVTGLCLAEGHSVTKAKASVSDATINNTLVQRCDCKKTCWCTLSELWRTRRRWSLSFSRGSLTRRTNERLYSRRLDDLWSAEVDRLVCSRARYKSPRESACILQSRPWPGKKDKQKKGWEFTPFFFFTFYSKIQVNSLQRLTTSFLQWMSHHPTVWNCGQPPSAHTFTQTHRMLPAQHGMAVSRSCCNTWLRSALLCWATRTFSWKEMLLLSFFKCFVFLNLTTVLVIWESQLVSVCVPKHKNSLLQIEVLHWKWPWSKSM